MTSRIGEVFTLAALLTFHPQAEPPPGPSKLTVDAQARPQSAFVGQSITLAVGVVSERERPELTVPKVEGATVELARVEQVPMSVGAIGDAVWQKSLYRSIFVVVPRRPGMIVVPSFVARVSSRTGRSTPVRLNARPLPAAGRPSTFLGGVGSFEVSASAAPSAVRPGQTVDYRVTVSGPGSRGISVAPDLERLASVPLGLRVERLPDVTTADPPSRTFVYRLRPTVAGEAGLPAVVVSGFDPSTERYISKATNSVRLRVAEPPKFDTSSLNYGRTESPGPSWPPISSSAMAILLAAGAAASAWVVLGAGWRARRREARRRSRWRAGAESDLRHAPDAAEVGRAIAEALAGFLAWSAGRPPGALTPDEAREGVARATDDEELAEVSARLLAACDRARFRSGTHGNPDSLRGQGLALIRALAEKQRPGEG